MKKLLLLVSMLLIIAGVGLFAAGKGWLGDHEGPGIISDANVPQASIDTKKALQAETRSDLNVAQSKQILFGDLHVHTTKSTDAFISSLPMMNGEGAKPLADACDFARFCSALDFWSINDHAEASTPLRWKETVESIRQCNAVSSTDADPDTVAFIGYEWTQVGTYPGNHYGHKNVIARDLEDGKIPPRPINSGGLAADALGGITLAARAYLAAMAPGKRQLDFARYVEETVSAPDCPADIPSDQLPLDCRESAETPRELFKRLNEQGNATMVIPHGTTWGFYTPSGSTWDKQLVDGMHDPQQQRLLEIMSGHGNSEEYRAFRGAVFDEEGRPVCPEPSEGYLPSCWRAGQIIEERCANDGKAAATCERLAANARQDYVNAGIAGHIIIGGETPEDWLDAGQCTDCYLPSFNYRPGGSAQYIMALRNFDSAGDPERFRFGFMASSDNHRARPGTGYKEFFRLGMADPTGPRDEWARKTMLAPDGKSEAFSGSPEFAIDFDRPDNLIATDSPVQVIKVGGLQLTESERQASYFMTGGLIAAHASGRDREAIWTSMENREVYGTSGDRILLWFDLTNGPGNQRLPMGAETKMNTAPSFDVRAAGAFKQKPGCPDYVTEALSAERLETMCRGECYNPSDERKLISRIEIVRILPQAAPGEDVAPLIQDPWKTHICEPDPDGCSASFVDEEYDSLARDAVYYARAIEAPSLAVNAGAVRCDYDENGECIQVNLCHAGFKGNPGDDCLAPNEERAWSSPIFVDWKR